jgi:peptidoglycan/xylan/chitin deacetylase (PgdA/CDA1 family)
MSYTYEFEDMTEAIILITAVLLFLTAGVYIWHRAAGRPRRIAQLAVRIGLLSGAIIPLVALATYQVMNARTFQLAGEIVPRVDTAQPLVALTFDDGPTALYTDQLLSVLQAKRAKATFFVVGAALEQQPELAKRLVSEGHELGNHSYSHQRMIFKSMTFIRDEIERTDALIRQAGYTGAIHFRSPYGKKLLLLPLYLQRVNKKNIFIDVEPDSYPAVAADADTIVHYVLAHTKPGSIIVLHAETKTRVQSLRAVPGIIDGLQAHRYRLVTVSQLLAAERGVTGQ